MENIINNPGLQHITELILLNLDFENRQKCQLLNKSCINDVFANPMFWLRKWKMQRGLSKENYNDWGKAIRLTKNTNVETNVRLYLEKVIKNGHVVDTPCFIDSDAVEKSTEYTYDRAFDEKNLGVLQILASMKNNPNEVGLYKFLTAIEIAAFDKELNVIKILAPIIKNPNECNKKRSGQTPIHAAAFEGHLDILKYLVTFTDDDPNIPDGYDGTPIYSAAHYGHIDVLKFLAPLTKDPNRGYIETPIQRAQYWGHHEFIRILQSYIIQ